MFQLDNTFLEEVGLGDLSEEQKQAFLDYFREQLEMRVGTDLSSTLSDAQLDEFESFMNRDMEKVHAWVDANIPAYTEDPIYKQLLNGAPENISSDVVLAEYASLKWLGVNRSDYREVVAKVMSDLKHETIANKEAILSSVTE